ncbi:hypothetical protein [Bizionia myxarmorum]|uniref:Uncharacterized protein n=1 Tax=Bizionia myxarmorum TaxID=291186 RepID=A0A5D0RBY0_9FLAO|nr:hypothetical protein [Bizionia myxarmorum]TYB79180.1 hypothetical protein ES674_05235 [Bizionia myxarmorum]
MIGRILKYSDFFAAAPPVNKFDLVKNIPRVELIATISGVNHNIKNPISVDFDNSWKNQIKLIEIIFLVNQNESNRQYSDIHCRKFVDTYKKENGSVTLFTRVSCLYGLNEIIFSKEIIHEDVSKYKFTSVDTENIFKFLILCNAELLSYNDNYRNEINSKNLGNKFFEVFMFKEIPHNQYYYIQNPLNLFQRAVHLFKYIGKSYPKELNDFVSNFKVKSPEEFISVIGNFFLSKGSLPQQLQVFYIPHNDKDAILRLNQFSVRGQGKSNTGIKKFEFLEIKKAPFYCNEGEDHNIYILMDNVFFAEKCYDLFFWDFYFDQLKNNGLNLEAWGGYVGLFFEEHIEFILKYSFETQRDVLLKTTNELLISGKEYADFYIRRKRQLIIGQAKRTYLPQIVYKEVYSLKDYDNIDKEEFYRRFGLYQLVETSLREFDKYINIIDPEIPKNKLFIYPVLVINEPIVSSGVASYNFDKKFEELLNKEGISRDSIKWRINKVTVIHINELENLQQSLRDKDFRLDNFLQAYADNSSPQLMNDAYAQFLNFDNFIRKKVKEKAIPVYIMDKEKGVLKLFIDFIGLK